MTWYSPEAGEVVADSPASESDGSLLRQFEEMQTRWEKQLKLNLYFDSSDDRQEFLNALIEAKAGRGVTVALSEKFKLLKRWGLG